MTKFPFFTRLIHWLSAVLVIFLFVSGWYMVGLDYYSAWYQTLPDLHQLIGVFVIVLWLFKIVRLIWVSAPPHIATLKPYERLLSRVVKVLFYLLVMGLGITGYLMATVGSDQHELLSLLKLPTIIQLNNDALDPLGLAHEYMAYSIMLLFILHVLAAFKHHLIDRDDTLRRMI